MHYSEYRFTIFNTQEAKAICKYLANRLELGVGKSFTHCEDREFIVFGISQ